MIKKKIKKELKKIKESTDVKELLYNDTSEIEVPEKMIDQVIGQDSSINLIRKVSQQKRHIMLIGAPGTGKSMIASALAEMLPTNKLTDIISYSNSEDHHTPIIKEVPTNDGRKIVDNARLEAARQMSTGKLVGFFLPTLWLIVSIVFWRLGWVPDVVFAAMLLLSGFLMVSTAISIQMMSKEKTLIPKILIDNSNRKEVPFVDATGAKAGALLGDVLHDPLQSGGLGTPPHLRVVAGMIHKANGGVLFIDEISALSPKSQQDLLTILQEKKYSITGQSEMSSGAMVRTTPAPCDFILIAAGNYNDLEKVHPAIRSRIRGSGYECHMNIDMEDNTENRNKIVQFVAQEISKDKKIPHFTKEAVDEIIFEARKKATRKNSLTLKLRELGGLIRAAGDLAIEESQKLVTRDIVIRAKSTAKTLEEQMVNKMMAIKKDYDIFRTTGTAIGRVNGLAVMNDTDAGLLLPIECEITPAHSKTGGKVIATGQLGEIAKESVENVSAIIKKLTGKNISDYDIHIQFLQTHNVEGDSASISIATSIISVLENIPVKQDIAMTGSLSIRGDVLPIGGVTAKVNAAKRAKIKKVIIPESNKEDLVLSPEVSKDIEIIPVKTIWEVILNAFKDTNKKEELIKRINKTYSLKLA